MRSIISIDVPFNGEVAFACRYRKLIAVGQTSDCRPLLYVEVDDRAMAVQAEVKIIMSQGHIPEGFAHLGSALVGRGIRTYMAHVYAKLTESGEG